MSWISSRSRVSRATTLLNRQAKTNCQICDSRFQIFINQEHQCKRCNRSVCDKCLPHRTKIYQTQLHSSVVQRTCPICKKEEDLISFLIQENNLRFRTTSKVSQQWIKKQNRERLSFQKIINQYEQNKCDTNSNIIRFKSQRKRYEEMFTKNYNYSLRQFLGRMIEDVSEGLVRDSVSNVIIATYSYLKNIPYTPELMNIVVFLLCFCNESQSYFIISRFIERTFPQYQRLESNRDCLHEFKMLMDMYSALVRKHDKKQFQIMTNYFERTFLHFTKSFTLNCTNIGVSFYLIDQMLTTNSYIYLYKGMAALGFICREIMATNSELFPMVQYIVNEVTIEKLKNIMIFFQRSNVKFQMVHQFFDSPQHRKLFEKYKVLETMHHKSQQKCRQFEHKLNQLAREHDSVCQKQMQASFKVMNLQQELVSLADKIVMLEQVQRLTRQNELLFKINQDLNSEVQTLSKQHEELNKTYNTEQVTRKMYMKMQDNYDREIVELKTKNQIFQIEKLANNIQFQTSFIDHQFQGKNRRIQELEKQNSHLHIQLDFYRKWKDNKKSIRNGSANQTHDQIFNSDLSLIYQEMDPNFKEVQEGQPKLLPNARQNRKGIKRLLQANRQVVQKLKSDLQSSQTETLALREEVKTLSQQLSHNKTQLLLVTQIKDFLSQIPEELNHLESIQSLEQVTQKETNMHKKVQLQSILGCYKNCYNEVRYRTLDARIKQNRIKQYKQKVSGQLSASLDSSKGQGEGQLSAVLAWFGSTEDILALDHKIKKKQQDCEIM